MISPFKEMVEADAARYDRSHHLGRLIALRPEELADHSIPGTEELIARILKALRACAALGQRHHWSYDLNRHIALLTAFNCEQARLTELKAQEAAQDD